MRPKALSGRVPRPKNSRRPANRTRIGLVLSAIVVALAIGTIALSRTSTQAQKRSYVATRETILDKATGNCESRQPGRSTRRSLNSNAYQPSTDDLTQVQHPTEWYRWF
jgi:hypothetical protein